MRCQNCGWENVDGSHSCEKCNSPLNSTNEPIQNQQPVNDNFAKSTVAEQVYFDNDQVNVQNNNSCPQCGYPVSSNSENCPNCNAKLKMNNNNNQPNNPRQTSPENQVNFTGTIRPGMGVGGPFVQGAVQTFCTLRPIAWQGEPVNYNPITYTGTNIILNRANTDANNNTITSREQAILSFKDGEWYIDNRSDLKSTYIKVERPIKLQDGDIIILGNREFEFKKPNL